MGPTNYKTRHNNYQPLRDQEQKARETTEQAATAENNEPQRNDRSLLDRMPGGPDRGDMVTHNTYAHWQARVSHAQRMEQQAAETTQHERMHARDRIEQDASQQREVQDERPPARERVEQSINEQRPSEPALDPSRSKEIER